MSCLCSGPATSTAPSASSSASVSGVLVEENVALARHTTIGTGGPARWFARPETIDELQSVLRLPWKMLA